MNVGEVKTALALAETLDTLSENTLVVIEDRAELYELVHMRSAQLPDGRWVVVMSPYQKGIEEMMKNDQTDRHH